ncbi:MAG: putative porin [Steroidobacteraceae bacterium]
MARTVAVLALAASCTMPVLGQSGVDVDKMRQQVGALRAEQARLADLQRKIDDALQSLEAELAAMASPAPVTPAAAVVSAAPAASRLSVAGDVRLRAQGDYSSATAPDRHSGQFRARLGATFMVSDHIAVGARLVTGDPDDPNSTDVQLSSFLDDLQVSLDLAYVQFNLGELKVYGGKLPQPFVRTDLVWDGDVNPQGLGAVYRHGLGSGGAVRASGLYFVVDEQAVGSDSTMLGVQLGYDSPAHRRWTYDVSAAFYDYRLGSVTGGDAGDFRSNLLDADGNYVSDYDLGDLIVGVGWSGAGDRWPVRIVGDHVRNFGAARQRRTGLGVELAVGRASHARDWRITYGYSVAEVDAVLAAFSHDNIGLGTNYRMHALAVDYVPVPRTLLSAIWYRYRPDQTTNAGGSEPHDWLNRLRLAFLASF